MKIEQTTGSQQGPLPFAPNVRNEPMCVHIRDMRAVALGCAWLPVSGSVAQGASRKEARSG